MSTLNSAYRDVNERTLFGHPRGLFLLFMVEMWERFSYYGMRGLLVLYLIEKTTSNNPGRGWSEETANNLYGWYTSLAYLMPLFGGIIADKLIGTHRSMVVGSILIALGHIVLAISGMGPNAHSTVGLSIFMLGLALIVLGTGHFKPTVSVMVGQLYAPDDPRRDGAFTIFYMGINLGAFICAFVCGTLGEKIGWHWGFGSAAVGMLLGLGLYLIGKPVYLRGIGSPPAGKPAFYAPMFMFLSIGIAVVVGLLYYHGAFSSVSRRLGEFMGKPGVTPTVWGIITALILLWSFWYVISQEANDRGPVICILLFILFNAVFWFAFEQAGSSLNIFAKQETDRVIFNWEMPATWFQSVNPLLIILLAPVFAGIWSFLGRRNMNPSQPMKIAIALLLVGGGYVFMVIGALRAKSTHDASMFWLTAIYFVHTLGELCISPTGLAFVTRAAPARSVSFLMGLWFLSSTIAQKVGGSVAAQIKNIEDGKIQLFWYRWFKLGGQADFFLLFVIAGVGTGILVLVFVPLLKKLLHGRE